MTAEAAARADEEVMRLRILVQDELSEAHGSIVLELDASGAARRHEVGRVVNRRAALGFEIAGGS